MSRLAFVGGARSAVLVSLCALFAFSTGCGASKRASMSVSAPSVEAGPVAPLNQSLFARTPNGQLSEEDLQAILDKPLELDLPARVGVLPIVAAEDWRGPGPDYDRVPAGVSRFSKKLPSDDAFTLVTEMMPIPSGALGMEALREIAARYKLRYIVLYRENVRRRVHVNPWAAGYVTVVGALFLPGSTLLIDGHVEASLFDVKTGLLMFTVRRDVNASQKSNVWYRGDKLEQLQAKLAERVGAKLAGDLRGALFNYAQAVQVENERKIARAQAGQAHDGAISSSETEQPPNQVALDE